MICFPNAKINIGLNIIEKRPDGFHNIESVFYPVPFCDVMEVKPAKRFEIKTFGYDLDISENENILYNTWELFRKKYQISPLEIALLKNIPPGSGLGGGSSDAAFLIKIMNDFFELNLNSNQLKNLAAQIGSDCPFFIKNKPALVTGKGEKIEKIPLSLKGLYLIIIGFNLKISSVDAYSNIHPQKPVRQLSDLIKSPTEYWKDIIHNDFEQTIFDQFEQIKEMKNQLYHTGAIYASMTGSGSAIYGLFSDKPKLRTNIANAVLWEGSLTG